MFEHLDEGLCVLDEHRRISFVNPAGAVMLGYGSPDELLGLPAHEAIRPGRPAAGGPPPRTCPHLAALDRGGPFRGDGWFARKDGSLLPVDCFSAPLRLPRGRGALVAFRDVGERRRAELECEREHEFLDAVLDSLDTGIVACDPQGTLSLLNRAAREMHEIEEQPLRPEDWAGRHDLFMPDGETPMPVERVPLFRALRGEEVRNVELVIAAKDRPPRTVLCNGRAIATKDGRALGAVVAMHDVTDRRRAEEQLAHQALHDGLTGLPNRALLLDRLEHALAVAQRNGRSVAVLFVGLDRFKLVNDRLGHGGGDELLVAVARRLDAALRAADTIGRPTTVARHEGDEFVVLCEALTDERGASLVAERILSVLAAPFRLTRGEVFAGTSIGIAMSADGATPDSLLRNADAAMHRAKELGGVRYELFDQRLRKRVIESRERESALRRAIDAGELRLHYQPIVSLPGRRVVAAEALVRWEHPQRGLLAPAEFIELAEESGLIVPLGAWVLRESCRQIARWQELLGRDVELEVSINISARQLADPLLVEHVESALRESGAQPRRLALEITETVLMEDGETPVETLDTLKRLGTRLVLDDFGTGYSSLSYLARLPLDMLKLDRSFVAPLGPGGQGRAIAAAVVELAHALDMTLVAEGVEAEDQLGVLKVLGCDFAQGYLFARPMPAAEMTALLAARPARAAR